MGRSITIHCIGRGPKEIIDKDTYRHREYHAMSKLEIKQEIEKAHKRNESIVEWYAQTKMGCKILGDELAQSWPVSTSKIALPKTVTCAICRGQGYKKNGAWGHSCPVCNGSGICKKGNENKWQSWQLERMRADFA